MTAITSTDLSITNNRDRLSRIQLTEEMLGYVLDHGTPMDEVQRTLIERTQERFGAHAGMQIAPEQGGLLWILARISGARSIVEVGTFTGYSALCFARALPEDGHLLCCDISEEWTSLARDAWREAGVDGKVELKIGPALDTLRALPAGESIDLSFVDADKIGYWAYFEELLVRTRPGGLLLFDNTLYAGKVLDPAAEGNPAAIREFNRKLAADLRVEVVLLPLADGLTIARKR